MTVLYKPVLIESVEQAEALPSGTVATYGGGSMTLTAHRVTSLAMKPDAWNVMDDLLSSSDMVGWTALVPIEAEEEWGEQAIAEGEFISVARLVTPWEEVANRP